jgi:hypothetical protein
LHGDAAIEVLTHSRCVQLTPNGASGAENPVMSCDLQVFVEKAAKAV